MAPRAHGYHDHASADTLEGFDQRFNGGLTTGACISGQNKRITTKSSSQPSQVGNRPREALNGVSYAGEVYLWLDFTHYGDKGGSEFRVSLVHRRLVSELVQAEPQTVAQLLAFIDRSDLDPMVKKTAKLKINKPHLTFAELTEATNVRAARTAMRRYNRAEDAAIAAGFTIPPLPTLDDVAREALESERNDNGRNEGDRQDELEAQLVHS